MCVYQYKTIFKEPCLEGSEVAARIEICMLFRAAWTSGWGSEGVGQEYGVNCDTVEIANWRCVQSNANGVLCPCRSFPPLDNVEGLFESLRHTYAESQGELQRRIPSMEGWATFGFSLVPGSIKGRTIWASSCERRLLRVSMH